MNITNAIDNGENPQPIFALNAPKMNINDIRQIIMIWPAIMFAKRRIINAHGFVYIPRISTGIKIIVTPNGTGGLKICAQ